MNAKNRLIEKLLRVAKRHKILTYPVLALVALISIFSYFFNWSTGAGKRVVAIVMVMVMLVSQSYFLTSSANGDVDTPEDVTTQEELQKQDEESKKSLVDAGEVETPVTPVPEEKEESATGTGEEDSAETPEGNTDMPADAEELVDSENALYEDQPSATADEEFEIVRYSIQGDPIQHREGFVTKDAAGNYHLTEKTIKAMNDRLSELSTNYKDYYTYDGWYTSTNYELSSKINLTTSTNLHINDPTGQKLIMLYAKRTLDNYKVKIIADRSGGDGTYASVEDARETGVSDEYIVPAVTGANGKKTGSFTITGIKKTGYGVSASQTTVTNNGSAKLVTGRPDGDALQISLSGDEYNQEVVLEWDAKEYKITYALEDILGTSNTTTDTVTYDDPNAKWKTGKDLGVKEPGGDRFDHWEVSAGEQTYTIYPNDLSGGLISSNKDLQAYLFNNQDTAVLYPKYKYVGIVVDEGDQVRRYEYDTEADVPETIKGHYSDQAPQSSDNFRYELIDEDSDAWGEYGLKVEAGTKGITINFEGGKPKKVSTDGIKIKYKIIDQSADNKEAGPFTLTIYIDKQTVDIDFGDLVEKTYDGTDKCTLPEKSIKTKVQGITVTFDSCKYSDYRVGDRDIILEGVTVNYNPEELKDLYTVAIKEGSLTIKGGKINKRKINVATVADYKYNRSFVRAGEQANDAHPEWENPILGVKEIKESGTGIVDIDSKWSVGDLVEIYVKDNLKNGGDRDDQAMLDNNITSKTYFVLAKMTDDPAVADVVANYELVQNGAIGTDGIASFDVVLEAPVERDNYIITGDLVNGWYGSQTTKITPKITSGYNKVRTSKGWEDELILSEANTVDGRISVQLHSSVTGAFTSVVTPDIQFDNKGPDYVDCTVRQDGTSNPGAGLYFPSEGGSVSFGQYYNTTILIDIVFRDTLSKPNTLKYALSGTLATAAGQNGEESFFAQDQESYEEGYAVATIEIPLSEIDKRGEIEVQAVDTAGNTSDIYKLTLKETDEDAYEWTVEKTGPTVSNINVKSIDPDNPNRVTTAVSGDGHYYSNCTASIEATDDISGIYGVTWYINGEKYLDEWTDKTKKVTSEVFTLDIKAVTQDSEFSNAEGKYEIAAVVWDNAKNGSNKKTFDLLVDDVKPVLVVTSYKNEYAQHAIVEFYTYDELSGVPDIGVYDEKGNRVDKLDEYETVEDKENGWTIHYCRFETSTRGNYTIIVRDGAGNTASEYIPLDKISNETPNCPKVTFNPNPGNNGWITSKKATANITNVTKTSDGMDVITYYQLWEKDDNPPLVAGSIPSSDVSMNVPIQEGIYNMLVWSESRTGKKCNNTHKYVLQVDGTAPTIKYQLQKGSGNNILVTFTVTDAVSGVNRQSIKVMHSAESVLLSLDELETGNGYIGTFEITEAGSYTIQAADIAGNATKTEAFSPMSLKVNAVKNITRNSATVGARILKGTYDIKSASIAYRKAADTAYTQTDAVLTLDKAGNGAISAVLNGLAAGTNYVYKITAVSQGNEVLEYVGYFRTLSSADAGATIRGLTRYADGSIGRITVGLMQGNNCIRAVELEVGPDKNKDSYNFEFTNVPDGSYNLVATDGTYSKSVRVLIANGKIIYPDEGILLELSGINTSVAVETHETPDISADFNHFDDLLDDKDRALIQDGGTVEYQLTARLIRVTNVSTEALAALYAVPGMRNKVVGAYLDISLYKIVTDADGNVTKKRVTSLYNGKSAAEVDVTVPLGDLAGKPGLTMVGIHQNGNNYSGRRLDDIDNNYSTYTIRLTQFSTFAILYDGDGTDNPTTEDSNAGGSTTETPGSSSENSSGKSQGIAEDTSKKTSSPSVGSLRSSGSAKTGDEAPIAVLGMMMILAAGGCVVLRRKIK